MYCPFKDSGSKNYTRYDFGSQGPQMGSIWTLWVNEVLPVPDPGQALGLARANRWDLLPGSWRPGLPRILLVLVGRTV